MSHTLSTARPHVTGRRRITSIVAAAATAALLVVVPNTPAGASAAKVTICHQVGNLSKRRRRPAEFPRTLGTDPLFQRRGVGRALLEPVLARADEAGVPTYLETQTESNLAYYQRFGFAAIDSFTVDDSPPLRLMQREPR
jgi:GNAT superfamily N-acetyltransferase